MKSPLLVLASCFALGILLARPGHVWAPGVALLLSAAGVCLLAGLLALRREWLWISFGLALFGFVVCGAAAGQLFEQRFPPNHVSHLSALGVDLADPVRLEGRLVSNPVRSPDGFQFDLEVDRLESRGQVHFLTGKVQLRLQAASDPEALAFAESLRLEYGDPIRVLARLRRPRIYLNPGSFDFRRWMESIEDIAYVGAVKSPHLIEKLPAQNGARFAALFQAARQRLLEGIDRVYPPWSVEGRSGAVLKAVLLGDRSALDSGTIENFRKTGLYHLLVISGLHVGLLALIVGAVLSLARAGETWRCGLLLFFLFVYAALVEQRAPTLRATFMIAAYLLGRFLYRERSLLNAVGLAGLALLLVRPAWLFESGFQLSFSAALIIGGLAVPILDRTTEPLRRALWQLSSADYDVNMPAQVAQFRLDVRSAVSALSSRIAFFERHPAMAESLAAGPLRVTLWAVSMLVFSAILQFGLLLPMAETFHRVTYAGIGLNAVAIPVMTLLLGFAVPTVLLGGIAPSLAIWPAKGLALIMRGLFTLTDWNSLPAGLSYRVPAPPLWVSLAFAAAMVAAAWTLGRHAGVFWASLGALAITGGLISIHPFAPRIPSGTLEVTALDCGGGDSIFLVLPGPRTMLMDACGMRTDSGRDGAYRGRRWDPGEDIVSNYLWSRGIKKLDVVALSHAHADHLGGLGAVVRNFQVGEFWRGANPPTPAYQTLLAEVERRGIPMRQVAGGDRIPLGGASIEVLWPPSSRVPMSAPSNDDSVVMRVTGAGGTVLLAGDISEKVELELMHSGTRLESTVLKVAHHGAKDSSSVEFLTRVSPSVAMTTGDGPNLPAIETLDRLRRAGARLLRTDLEGAVTAEIQDSRLTVRTYRPSVPE
jgi:competence protein ComEC